MSETSSHSAGTAESNNNAKKTANKCPGHRRRNNNNNRSSKSPVRNQQQKQQAKSNRSHKKSKSPHRNDKTSNNNNNQQYRRNHQQHHQRNASNNPHTPAAMTVIINRCDLWDSAAQFPLEAWVQPKNTQNPGIQVDKYSFVDDPLTTTTLLSPTADQRSSVVIARVPYCQTEQVEVTNNNVINVIDTSIPNPHDPTVVHDKYWAQRRRLFSRFDQGIQLDSEGWYSVTPELIADHVAHRVSDLASQYLATANEQHQEGQGIVILDAFCGCGGNAIAFGKLPSHIVSQVVCVDTDRSKLLKAAHNASLYNIPKDKLVFVQCNSIFILQYCYQNGNFVLDQPTTTLPQYMPPPIMPTTYAGYHVGGLDMLPRHIDMAFLDPPWGGVDYELLGKNGYDLEKNMKIRINPEQQCEDPYQGDGDDIDDFFDSFVAAPKQQQHHNLMSKNARKKNFNKKTEGEFVSGKELIQLAAKATKSRVVLFDLPRNTSKTSLGICALAAGYRGNIKLEEHYLNGRLKTVTAYFGSDYSSLIHDDSMTVGINNEDDNAVDAAASAAVTATLTEEEK